ncbi:hypothetical protein LJC44_06110, partial [Parabacteroides sp. OttesenSCG-928-G06]|nr:hypothetical protein [Parabacteroides sp. OttesenSCG-928-G06]
NIKMIFWVLRKMGVNLQFVTSKKLLQKTSLGVCVIIKRLSKLFAEALHDLSKRIEDTALKFA